MAATKPDVVKTQLVCSFADVQTTTKKANGFVIHINASVEKLGEKCNALLPMHALTGCDSNSYPFGEGKVSALSLLRKHGLQFLQCFGELNSITDEVTGAGHQLFCLLLTGCRLFFFLSYDS